VTPKRLFQRAGAVWEVRAGRAQRPGPLWRCPLPPVWHQRGADQGHGADRL